MDPDHPDADRFPALGQEPNDLFPDPDPAAEDVVVVDVMEFARVPDFKNRALPGLMHLEDEPGRGRSPPSRGTCRP